MFECHEIDVMLVASTVQEMAQLYEFSKVKVANNIFEMSEIFKLFSVF